MTVIFDDNCPNGPSVVKISGRVWGIGDGTLLRCSAIGNPADWTPSADIPRPANSAAFLDVGQHSGGEFPTALGLHQGYLAVMFANSTQIWEVDANPDNWTLNQILPIGCVSHRSVQNISGQLLFLSPNGFRSLSFIQETDNLQELDIGTPIQSLTRRVAAVDFSMYSNFYGQYWCGLQQQTGTQTIWVLTIAQTVGLLAWSQYEFCYMLDDEVRPVRIRSVVEAGDNIVMEWVPIDSDANTISRVAKIDSKMFSDILYDESLDNTASCPVQARARSVLSDLGGFQTHKPLLHAESTIVGNAKLTFEDDRRDVVFEADVEGDERSGFRHPMMGLVNGLRFIIESDDGRELIVQEISVYYRRGGIL